MMNIDYIFDRDRTKLSLYVDTNALNTIKDAFYMDLEDRGETLLEDDAYNAEQLFIFLLKYIHHHIEEAQGLNALIQKMKKELASTFGLKQRQQVILDFSSKFDPSRKALYEDERAFERWFDEDALTERIQTGIAKKHRLVITAVERLIVIHQIFMENNKSNESIWQSFDLNHHFLYFFKYHAEVLLIDAVFKTFLHFVKPFGPETVAKIVDKDLIAFLYTFAFSSKEDVWIQNDAIEFIFNMDTNYFMESAQKHFSNVEKEDMIFVRHKIAKLCIKLVNDNETVIPFIKEVLIKDPSPYVRQAVAKNLIYIKKPQLKDIKASLILDDPEKSVRALAITQILNPHIDREQRKIYQNLIWKSIETEKEPFVIKTALYCIREMILRANTIYDMDHDFMQYSFEKITDLLRSELEISLKRYAAKVREMIWLTFDSERYSSYQKFVQFRETIKVGQGKKIPLELLNIDKEELFRILSIVAQEDFSLELRYNISGMVSLHRAEKFKRRTWRIIYELTNAFPDKREAFLHTIARVYEGTYHFPSTIMAEQAPTKVPGEPYYIPEEESYRPFIPLPDHFLSSLTQSTLTLYPYKIYTSDGVTVVEIPKGFWRRLKAKWHLSFKFAKIARLRNWRSDFIEPPSSYIDAMRELGFKVSFSPYVKEDTSTTKFFSFLIPLPLISPELQESIGNYFLSAYENTLNDLLFFVIIIFGLFFFRHLAISYKIKKARKRIPLSIGGWGTRGKSGTERLKAALFNGLGYRVFSKTTGNEAMFLHSESFDTMLEMYLFRPYDKATIWEQANTVLLASELEVDIYLWESMGLTPAYVEILQQRWMQDDIATITNTYPDHENLQGPAGINIPQVMTNFIPSRSILVSTEEIMAPILKSHAKSVDTKYHQKGWLEAGLIAPDILSRFPYEEHPNNIALVLGVAEELEINQDEALKTMADFIVPDLGVLKAYPPAKVGNKTLSFINGMSANERFGALGNWKRMGLGEISDEKDPSIYITAVINNRADRVARSRVFASMMIEDIVADRYILIGSNLSGFQSYLDESWKLYKEKLSLDSSEGLSMNENLLAYARKYRLVRSKEQLDRYLQFMLEASAFEAEIQKEIREHADSEDILRGLLKGHEEILFFYQVALEQYSDYQNLVSKISQNVPKERVNESFREYIWKWIKKKIVIVYDYHATGNEVIRTIYNHTPSGKHNKIIGMQNIKGTGLDFAYQWIEWDKCYKICKSIQSMDRNKIYQDIDALAAFDQHNMLTVPLVEETIAVSKQSVLTQNEYLQAQIKYIEETIKERKKSLNETEGETRPETRFTLLWRKILNIIEAFLDAGDAVKRRKTANRIYKDLIRNHISHKRASIELKKITERQKGGWLFQRKLK